MTEKAGPGSITVRGACDELARRGNRGQHRGCCVPDRDAGGTDDSRRRVGPIPGEIFEKTDGEAPRGIRLGGGQVIPALEQGLVGIAPGDKRRIEIASADAFGPYRDDPGMKTRIPRESLSHRLDPHVGMRLNAAVFADENSTEAQHVPVTIIEVTDEYLLVDAKHPLAGKDLVFDVEAVDIIPAGHP